MGEKEIQRLTAEIHRFAFSKDWLPKDGKPVWQQWRRLGRPLPSSHNDADWMAVWEDCSTLLNGLIQNRNSHPFLRPVDPIKDGVPNYLEVVKRPMDLGTVKQKLALNARRRHETLLSHSYRHPLEFKADVNLVWDNCALYNPPGFPVHVMGEALKADFERRWKAMNIEQSIEAIDRKLSREKSNRSIVGRHEPGRHLSKRPEGVEGMQENKNGLKKTKTGVHDRGTVVDRSKMKPTATGGHRVKPKPKPQPIKTQHRIQGDTKPMTTQGDGRSIEGDVERKKVKEPKDIKRGVQMKGGRSLQGRKMEKLLQICRKPMKDSPMQPIKRKWVPPIIRGANHQPATMDKNPTQTKKPSPMLPVTEWKKIEKLNNRLKRSLVGMEGKKENEMSDYEARRQLSMILETISLKVIGRVMMLVSRDHPSSKTGIADIDSLDINTVRFLICQVQRATKHKEQEMDEKAEIQRKDSPVTVDHPPKRKKTEDEGFRLATKTPMVKSMA